MYIHASLVVGSPELDGVLQVWPKQRERKVSSLDLQATLLLIQPRVPLSFSEERAHC